MKLKVLLTLTLLLLTLGPGAPPHPAQAGMRVSVTRQFSPFLEAAETVSAGDNDGFQTTPGNAFASDNVYAVDTDSGDGDNTACTSTGADKHRYYNYGITDKVPTGSTIQGITVRADIAVDSLTHPPFTCIQLSWDGGTNWTTITAAYQKTLTAIGETTYTYGGPADLWGTTWDTTKLNNTNFRVRVINGDDNAGANIRDFSLDWLPVSITYTAPWDSYSNAARTTVCDSFTGSGNTSCTPAGGTTVYMRGTGFSTAQTYQVAYYDGGGTWWSTQTGLSAADMETTPSYQLNSNIGAAQGFWNAVAYPYPLPTPPATYTADGNRVADDQFNVASDAIPELPDVLAGLGVVALSAGIYFWLKRRKASQESRVRSQESRV